MIIAYSNAHGCYVARTISWKDGMLYTGRGDSFIVALTACLNIMSRYNAI